MRCAFLNNINIIKCASRAATAFIIWRLWLFMNMIKNGAGNHDEENRDKNAATGEHSIFVIR